MNDATSGAQQGRRWSRRKVIFVVAGVWLGFIVVAGLIGTLTHKATPSTSTASVTPTPTRRASLVTYCGTPNAATLASFTGQYQQARGDWDRDVRAIWGIAREKKPPTF
jgi:hypothetical protein